MSEISGHQSEHTIESEVRQIKENSNNYQDVRNKNYL